MSSKSHTSRKLDWLTCVRFDRRVTDYAYRVASVIAAHLNEVSGRAFLSLDSIAFESGCKWPRKAVRAIKLLQATGWVDWKHSKTANIYAPNYANVKTTLEAIGRARYEKRQIFLNNPARLGRQRHSDVRGIQTMTPVSYNHLENTSEKRVAEEDSE